MSETDPTQPIPLPPENNPDPNQPGYSDGQHERDTLPPDWPVLHTEPFNENNFKAPPSPQTVEDFNSLLKRSLSIANNRLHLPGQINRLEQQIATRHPKDRQLAADEQALSRLRALQSSNWEGTQDKPGDAAQLASVLRAQLKEHPSLAIHAERELARLREKAEEARLGVIVDRKTGERSGGLAEAAEKHAKARNKLDAAKAAQKVREAVYDPNNKEGLTKEEFTRRHPEGTIIHDRPDPREDSYGRPKGDGWNRLPSGRIPYGAVNRVPQPVRTFFNQRPPRQTRDKDRVFHEEHANRIADKAIVHAGHVHHEANYRKEKRKHDDNVRDLEFRAQTLEEILAMAGNANYTPPATEQQLVGEWSDPDVYSDYMTSRLTEGLDEYLADANGKVSDQNRTAMHSTLSQLHNYLATIDESLTADGHSWTEFQKVAKLRGRVNKAYLGGRYRYEQLLRATGQGDALYTENGGLQLQDGSEVTLHSDGSYEYFDELRNRNVRRDAEGNEWRTPQASTDTAPAPEEGPEDANAETMYDNYLSALEWWQRDQTPESAVKAAGLAARFAEKYAEAENDPVARQHGNKAAYWEHYLKTMAQRNLSADTRLLPRGEVVIQRATFYGQQGTWGIGANGTKSLLTTDANNEFVVVEEYNSAGYRVR